MRQLNPLRRPVAVGASRPRTLSALGTSILGGCVRFGVGIALALCVSGCDDKLVEGLPSVDVVTDGQVSDVGGGGQPCDSATQCPKYGDPCQQVTCEDNVCRVEPRSEGSVCDDGDPCTGSTTCTGGTCKGTALCECKTTADCASKEDADLCNGSLSCQDGFCKVWGPTVVKCSAVNDSACSKNTCKPDTGKCAMKWLPDAQACDDGEACTVDTVCKAGVCQGGLNKCDCLTTADCEAKENGNACDGLLYCDTATMPHKCVVNPATVVNCSTQKDQPCHKNLCNPLDGKCSMQDLPDKDACEFDGVACTVDACAGGKCKQGPITNACTCGKDADCAPLTAGDLCAAVYYCNLAKKICEPNVKTAVKCPTLFDTPCTHNQCQPATGTCAMTTQPDQSACDDGKTCTKDTVCKAGECAVTDAADNTCDCSKSADCVKFEDGDLCNGTLYCNMSAGKCEVNPATVVSCPDIDVGKCHINTCDPKSGKCGPKAEPNGTACDADGSFCTSVDDCTDGKCIKADPNVCNCQQQSDCVPFEDGNACNGTLYCDVKTNTCVVNPATVVSCPDSGQTCLPNVCDPASGACKAKAVADGTPCDDDGFMCSKDACKAGKCELVKEDCLCWENADCGPFAGDDMCAGELYCDKAAGPPACKLNPATKVWCKPYGVGDCVGQVCDPKDGVCKATAVNPGVACDDGNKCSKDDKCAGGACVGLSVGATLDCDDSNPCTAEACHADKGCVYFNNTFFCDDGDVCTTGDKCQDGKCLGGGAMVCNDAKVCTQDACDPIKGCQFVPAADAPCDDGNLCTAGDTCKAGACQPGAAKDCDDGAPCTTDACAKATGCAHTPNTAPCDDGNPCTTPDTCKGGSCVGGPNTCKCKADADCAAKEDGDLCNGTLECGGDGVCAVAPATVIACKGGTPCAPSVCAPKTGKCDLAPLADGTVCDDGDPCTVGGSCAGGKCQGTAVNCDDGNACTTDACDPADGKCKHTPGAGTCDDGKKCTGSDACVGGVCAGKPVACDDSNPCTTDACDPADGKCKHTPNTATCNDNNPCTTDDTCSAGKCAGKAKTCDDGSGCTVDSCDPATGACVNTAKGCDDADKCTVDTCSKTTGQCLHAPKNCDDGDACTEDTCEKAMGGCLHKPTLCADLDPCTVDACAKATGKCTHLPKGCDDDNLCTADSCHPTTGACTHTQKDCNDSDQCTLDGCDAASGNCTHAAKKCDDANACTADSCVKLNGTCVHQPKICDDSNACTLDGCEANSGQCVFVPTGAACNDGDACTKADKCTGGACKGVPAVDCDDADACTTDACNPKTGVCSHTPIAGCVAEVTLPYHEAFDCGSATSKLWVFDPVMKPGQLAGWNVDNLPDPPGWHTPGCSLNFNNQSNIAAPPDDPSAEVTGTATSPWIKLPKATGMPVRLQLRLSGIWSKFDGHLYGEYTTDDKTFKPLAAGEIPTPSSELWVLQSLQPTLTASKIKLRFRFLNTDITSSLYTGPFIDDLRVFDPSCAADADCTQGTACVPHVCKLGQCEVVVKPACDDGNACTKDLCDPKTGNCSHPANADGSPCSDGQACTPLDACKAGSCVGTAKCDDGNPCTTDTCDQLTTECTFTPVNPSTTCDDSNPCTVGDSCAGGFCSGTPGPCGVAYYSRFDCGSQGGWAMQPPAASGLSTWDVDGVPGPPGWLSKGCSLNVNNDKDIACGAGQTAVDWTTTSPEFDLTGAKTAGVRFWMFNSLYGSVGQMVQPSLEISSDGFQTIAQTVPVPTTAMYANRWAPLSANLSKWAGGKVRLRLRLKGPDCALLLPSVSGRPGWFVDDLAVLTDVGKACSKTADCDDNNGCTQDDCVAGKCQHVDANGLPCEDNNPCSLKSRCAFGACVSQGDDECDDLNPCTHDTCDPNSGCVHQAMPDHAWCTDNSSCTQGDACKAGKCQGVLDCDDGNSCTTDACDGTGTKCVFTPLADGAACSDGDACTSNDTCGFGQCQGWPGACTKLFSTDMACTDGAKWIMDPAKPEPELGWHLDATPAPPGHAPGSPKCSLNFNNGKNYVCASGATNAEGTATLATPLDLTKAVKAATLSFMSFYDMALSSSQDLRYVEFSLDGFKTVAKKHWLRNTFNGRGMWVRTHVDLSAFAGKQVGMRLRVDSAGCLDNGGAGWFVDDMEVRTDQPKTCVLEKDCDLGDPCFVAECGLGKCVYSQTQNDCDDGNACTTQSQCDMGWCAQVGALCNDNDSCTVDACVNDTCTHVAVNDGTACNDGDVCTAQDACAAGKCTGQLACMDDSPCTIDACALGVCSFKPAMVGAACEDGNACTTGDKCDGSGQCKGTAAPCTKAHVTSFNCGSDGGWTLDPKPKGSAPGWAVDGLPAPPGFRSPNCSLNYNNDQDCWGGTSAFKPTATAMSPVIDLTGAKNVQLRFWNYVLASTSASYDRRFVDLSTDDFNTVAKSWWIPDTNATGFLKWVRLTFDLSAFAGKKVRVRLRFDNVRCPSSEYDGWFVDDLELTTDVPVACGAGKPACNDSNPCTNDSCVAGACQYAVNTASCDDGSVCTVTDTCADGECVGSGAKNCDDGNACTADDCDGQKGCQHPPMKDGNPCSDGSACTTGDVCVEGSCAGVDACEDHNPCTLDVCSGGVCGHDLATNGSKCSDGEPCTQDDSCLFGACVSATGPCSSKVKTSMDCGDGASWTFDPAVAEPVTAWHLDATGAPPGYASPSCSLNFNRGLGFYCATGESKAAGSATWKQGIDLTKAKQAVVRFQSYADVDAYLHYRDRRYVEVSTDGFKTVAGSIQLKNEDAKMRMWLQERIDLTPFVGKTLALRFRFDSANCSVNSGAGWFVDDLEVITDEAINCGMLAPCNDNNPCTDDTCLFGKCSFMPNKKPCEDGNKCTLKDVCEGGGCSQAKTTLCDDGQSCTADVCDLAKGCTHTPLTEGAACDDGSACTTPDRCASGQCVGTPKCNDGDPCTTDTCDPAVGKCTYPQSAHGAPCDDGNGCTEGSACGFGGCVGGIDVCTYKQLLAIDFENCSKVGWTFSPSVAANQVGWQVDGNPDPPKAFGGSCALNFNNGKDYQSGAAVSGTATSMMLPAQKADRVELSLQSYNGVDQTSQDRRVIEATADGFKTTVLKATLDNWAAYREWETLTYNLPVPAGANSAQLRFSFDSVSSSGNLGPGWFVDDIKVRAGTKKACTKPADCPSDNNPCTVDACDVGKGTCTYTVQHPCDATVKAPYKQAFTCNDPSLYTWSFETPTTAYRWAVDSLPATPKPYSKDCSLNFNRDTSLLFCPTGVTATGGWVRSPRIDATGLTKPFARFMRSGRWYTTGGQDKLVLEGSVDGKGWVQLSEVLPTAASPYDKWQVISVDLAPLGSKNFWLRFRFVRNGCLMGAYEGPHIDDFEVLDGACTNASTCDDNQPCTNDLCTGGVCQHVAAPDYTLCNNGDICATNSRCYGGWCNLGTPKPCTDGNGCTVDSCDPKTGACVFTPSPVGSYCSDFATCTAFDGCDGKGSCVGNDVCDDGSICTSDKCDVPGKKCVYTAMSDGAVCNDGSACTTGEKCASGKCLGVAKSCDDGDPCTTDSCNPSTGQCTNIATPNCCKSNADCDDKLSCTADVCSAGTCVHTFTATPVCCQPLNYVNAFTDETGLTIVKAPDSPNVKWQVWNPAPAGKFISAPGVLYFGNPAAQNYDGGADVYPWGTVRTPEFIVNSDKVLVSFRYFLEVEPDANFDKVGIAPVVDGVVQKLNYFSKGSGVTMGAWTPSGILVNAGDWKGHKLTFEFSFDTVDDFSNKSLGWLIDDLKITQAGCL